MSDRKLTPKQQRFVDEYLIDLNATQACVRAGYSPRTARNIGHENLTKPDIAKAISARAKALHEKTELDQEMVLRQLVAVASTSLRDVVEWGPGGMLLKDAADLTPAQEYAIDEFYAVGRNIVPKLQDRLKALQKLGEHLNLFRPEAQITQNFLHLHFGGEEEKTEKPVEIEGLKLHLGD